MSTLNGDAERARLNRRIRVLDKDLARDLKHYRNRISKQGAVDRRGASMTFVPRGDSGFMEASDVIPLCHEFLDEHGIPADPGLDESSTKH